MAVTKTNACMACVDNVECISEDEDGNEQLRTQWCPTPKFWWRSDQSLMTRLGMRNRINPIKFLRFLYWFGQRIPIEQIVAYTGIKSKSAANAVRCIRLALTKKMIKMRTNDGKLGRGNTFVSMDCTYVTKRKPHPRLKGKTTEGHVTCIVGMTEVDRSTRKSTGRTILKVVEGERKDCLKKIILECIAEGALIYTDSAKAYAWLKTSNK